MAVLVPYHTARGGRRILGAARLCVGWVGVAGKNQVETPEMMDRGRQAGGGSRRVQGMQGTKACVFDVDLTMQLQDHRGRLLKRGEGRAVSGLRRRRCDSLEGE